MGLNSYQVTFESCGDHYRFTGETSKMSWAALPVEPACMGKVGEGTRRPPMFVGLAEQIKLQCSDIIKVKITI